MFEMIMLLAFLWAATSQLLPRKQANNRLEGKEPHDKKNQPSLQRATKKSAEPRVKAKPRNGHYAHAA